MRLWEKELQKLGRILHAIGDKTSGQHRSNKISRSQATQLAQVARTLNRLRQLLSQEYVRRAILPELSIHEELPLVAIDRLMKAVDRAVQDRSAGDKKLAGSQLVKNFNDRSPFEWLVGERLPQVFERHFKRPAGLSRTKGKLGGPYIRFVRQVLIELDITKNGRPFTDEAIGKALTKARAGPEPRQNPRSRPA
jgi:hypothetical protein